MQVNESDPIVIVGAKRTAIGNLLGGLSSLPAHQLGASVIRQLLDDASLDGSAVDEVILGQVLTADCGQNPARQASIEAGIPHQTPAWTVNQVCGSGLRTIALAVQAIITGQSNIVIAGGQENMSQAPHTTSIRNGVKMGPASLSDSMIIDGLWDSFGDYHMGVTAENIAKQYNISRQEQDEFSAASQQKAEAAIKANIFADEIVPVEVTSRKKTTIVDTDEFPRAGVTVEALAGLRPAFAKDGTVTAGNASGINDGAAAVLMMKESEAVKRGLTPLVRIVSFAQAGVDPSVMGTGPIPASTSALNDAKWGVDDLDIVEANEAFAAQAICVNREMKWDVNRVNIHGGAVALGHPIGASGARILTTLVHSLKRKGAGSKGLATLCIGGGMGVALCVEAC